MSSATAEGQENSESNGPPTAAPLYKDVRTTAMHQGYTLIGFAFVVFEIGFLVLYTNTFWFDVDLIWLGAPAAMLAMVVAHFILLWLEGPGGCRLFAPIFRRKPPLVYRRWLRLNDPEYDPGITFGERHLVWTAIDELELTFWGNLLISSRSLCGSHRASEKARRRLLSYAPHTDAEVVLKIPFGIAANESQNLFIDAVKKYNPQKNVVLNERLRKRLEAKEIKGQSYIQQLGVVFLFVVLLDVGQSMFNYLEMVKGYYLTCLTSQSKFYIRAEDLRQHPLPFSWVSIKVMREGKIAAGLFQDRAEALWALNRKEEAIESEKQSLQLSPTDYRIHLRLARMLEAAGHQKEAEERIDDAMELHKSAFLPRLYRLALRKPEVRPRFYDLYLSELDERLFGTELPWPPGGDTFLQDVWYRDDVTFVFDRLLKQEGKKQKAKTDARLE